MQSIFDLEFQHVDVDSKIAAALERLSQAFRVLLWEKGKRVKLSPIQIQILVYLYYHEHRETMGKIAREFRLTPATVSDAIKVLERKSLVSRQPLSEDRRVIYANLTTKGIKLAKQLSTWANEVRAVVATLPEEEKLVVLNFLMKLIESLQKSGIISVARMCITCKFFQPYAHAQNQAPHHCRLLDKPLAIAELRLDCPEHIPAEEALSGNRKA